jgi:nucleoside transporter
MPLSIRVRLSLMMFLNYVIWGAWYVTIVTYLTATLKFSDIEGGSVFGTSALACMISPFFVGLIADRFFATERVLAVLHLIGAVLLYLVTMATSFGLVYAIMFAYCLCYFPTVALTNSLTFRQVTDPGRDFPLIRVFATLGWIAVGWLIGHFRFEASKSQFLVAAGASLAMSIFSLALPHTPPPNKGQKITVRRILG